MGTCSAAEMLSVATFLLQTEAAAYLLDLGGGAY